VLQFAFGGPARHEPLAMPENRLVCTGTHDNDTIAAWWADAAAVVRERVLETADARGIRTDEPHWRLVELALSAPARVAVFPVQDLLGLGREARMNSPGTETGNWGFRLEAGALDAGLAARLRAATVAAGRASR
jgi:4-alpha-glucanotransferase